MANRNKRVFISDIHLGDARSMKDPHHYCWFKKNVPRLGDFLAEQSKAPDVKELVILGDLFDTWVIPVNQDPLASFEAICANPKNAPVIKRLKALAGDSNIKLAYVPGNHDMGMSIAGISATKQFMETTFPGMRFFCNKAEPWGVYAVGTLAAEHGNHYCLFNAPVTWTADAFLPLGYFISRIDAYKVKKTGHEGDPREIFFKFLNEYLKSPNLVEDVFNAIVDDADLKEDDIIELGGIPGYAPQVTIGAVRSRFSNLIQDWKNKPGNLNVPTAIVSDIGNLAWAASFAYFDHAGSNANIVIFGHTHIPIIDKHYAEGQAPTDGHPVDEPCREIYANSGTWVDQGEYGCTYVETEEDAEARRHYVRVKKYPDHGILHEGFVEM